MYIILNDQLEIKFNLVGLMFDVYKDHPFVVVVVVVVVVVAATATAVFRLVILHDLYELDMILIYLL